MRLPLPALPALALTLLVLPTLGTPAFAQWATGGAQLNEASQVSPVFVPDAAGGVREFTVLTDEIYGSGIRLDGTRVWSLVYGLTTYPTAITGVYDGTKTQLCAAPDGTGGYVMAWYDTRAAAAGTYVQRVDANGLPMLTANGVPVRLSNRDGGEIAICGDGAGGAFVAFQPRVVFGTVKFPVNLQHVLANGTLAWGSGVGISDLQGSDSREIRMISDGAGGAIVCWIDLAADAGLGDLFTQRVDGTGARQWGPVGVAVASIAGTIEHNARIVSDGNQGVLFAWEDNRLGYGTVHAEHVNSHGAGRWNAGLGVQVSANEALRPALARDPVTGGLFCAYIKPGIFSSPSYFGYGRLNSAGALVWSEQTFGLSYTDAVSVAADGVGGVVFAHQDAGSGVFASHVASDMSTSLYEYRLGNVPGEQPFVTGDTRGGFVAAWRGPTADGYFSNTDYAQRVTLNGTPGHVLPGITQIQDVANDEGGFVRLQVGAAGSDMLSPADPTFVTSYGLWRRIEQASLAPQAGLEPAAAGLRDQPASRAPEAAADRATLVARMRQGSVRLEPQAAALIGLPPGAWESIGLYPAVGMPTYSFVAPTRQDSSGTGRHREVFVVTAHTATNGLVGLSFADSGSSVDNLAPAPPTNLAGQFGAGALHLSWAPSPAADLAQYAIYRGNTAGFVPSAGSRLGYAAAALFADGAFVAGSYYKVTALDRHGNESAWATLSPAQTTDAPAEAALALNFLAPVQPNPMRGGGMVSFGLARAGNAELAVFDLTGRRVRTLAHGPGAAGEHRMAWDGRDEQGRALPGGLYWLRLSAPGVQLARKVVRAE